MDKDLAFQLIKRGEKLMYIRHVGGPLFLCRSPYDEQLNERCKAVPSWHSVYKPDIEATNPKGLFLGYHVHYLDLPTLEALAFREGYRLEYEDREPLKDLKREYLDRREWKEKQFVIVPANRPLRPYQNVGAQFMYRAGRALNADSMGSGKSAQAIGACILNKIDGRPHKTLIVCPTSVKGSWLHEVAVVSDFKAMSLHSNMEKRFEQYGIVDEVDMLVASYGSFLEDYEEIARHFKPDILILDEVHRICNRANKITQLLIGGKNIKKTFFEYANPHSIYLLTGSPIGNEMEDLYPMLKLLDPGIFSWIGFRNRYTILEEGYRWDHPSEEDVATALGSGESRPKAKQRKFHTVVGYQNEAELKGKLSLHMIRRTKDEVLPDLPEKQYMTLEVELDAEERKIYEDLRRQWVATVRNGSVEVDNHLAWMIRAQQICNSLETCTESSAKKSSKLDELLAIVNAEAPNRKIVIFSKFKEMTSILTRELQHWKPLHLHGEVPDEDRQPMIDAFQNDQEHRIFISTIKCGGVGITLTAADLCIFYDKWWSPAANEQAADRLHRIGQTNKVVIVTLRVKDSIEEYIEKCWIKKQLLVDDMIGIEKSVREMTMEQKEALI